MANLTHASDPQKDILRDHIKKPWRKAVYTEAWRNLPEVPNKEEINCDVRADGRFGREAKWNDYMRDPEYYHAKLPHNIIDGPWPSKQEYVSAHYQILREDAVAPLRNAVGFYKMAPTMMEDEGTCIYTHVTIKGLQLSPMGAAFRVEFSNERAGKKIRWEQSKRLIQGTIVALSPQKDNFNTICKVAVVAARPILGGLDQNPPQIDLFFAEDRDAVFDPAVEYVMIEAKSSYFEASRGMLEAMQKLMTEEFSLAPHIAHLDPNVTEPEHVTNHSIFNLAPLLLPDADAKGVVDGELTLEQSLHNVDILKNFPKFPESGMDASQIRALENMLTKKVSIIQGPPGTGKTFVSVGALKILLANLQPNEPPIIVSAQTNHALDQLLNHVLQFEPEILRLGGRSSKENEEIRKRTVYELRNNHELSRQAGGWGAVKFANKTIDNLVALIQDLMSPLTRDIVDIRSLHKHGIISETHYESFFDDDWAGENTEGDPFENWLPVDALEYIPRTPPINTSFELEDGEIQQEALAALEAEASGGAAGTLSREELEREALTGTWIGFGRTRTGRTSGMDSRDAKKLLAKHKSLHTIQAARRGDVYKYWLKKLDIKIKTDLRALLIRYRTAVDDLRLAKWASTIALVKTIGIKLIGCTTTGLSKYRGLISALQPRTILIEEAAETLEGTVIAGMVDSLQQLILVGDHRQLQATCNVASLAFPPYNMNISMFERLVTNNIPYVMLNKQRRMIPEIRKLLCVEPNPFYKDLYDHDSVKNPENRPPVPGMGGVNVYFFTHNFPEAVNSDNSKYNLDEAEIVVGHFVHLYLNGVPAEKITVLTFYNGQRKTIIQELKKHPALSQVIYFNCFTVDSYQGEENDVILLSLVRSNNVLSIGFLENKNRVVVALSRARRGFYLFGNALTLAAPETDESSMGREALWSPLIHYMAEHKQFNMRLGLPIQCQNHNKTIYINESQDWFTLAGGCFEKCLAMLSCGHPCHLNCHPFDHSTVGCTAPCPRALPCGHGCSSTCGAGCRCDACQVRFTEDMEAVDLNMPDPDLPWLEDEEPPSPPRNERGGRNGRGGRGGRCRGRGRGGATRDVRNEEPHFPSTHTREGSLYITPAEQEARTKAWHDLANGGFVAPNVVAGPSEPSDEAPPIFKEKFREVRVNDDGTRSKMRAVESIHRPINFVSASKDDGEFPTLGEKVEKRKIITRRPRPIPNVEDVDVLAMGHALENTDLNSASPQKKEHIPKGDYGFTGISKEDFCKLHNGNSSGNGNGNGASFYMPSNTNTNFFVAPPADGSSRFAVITDDLRDAFARVEVAPRVQVAPVAGPGFGGFDGVADEDVGSMAGEVDAGVKDEEPTVKSEGAGMGGSGGSGGTGGSGLNLIDLDGLDKWW